MRKSAFSTAEVALTVMVLGIVIIMALSVLTNIVAEKQYKTPYKESVAILSNALGLLISKEETCTFTGQNNDISMAKCLNKVLNGDLYDNKINAKNGMTYYFMPSSLNRSGSLEDVCGFKIGEEEEDWMGERNCKVVVDVNGTEKGTKDFSSWNELFGNEPDDQFLLVMSSQIVKPAVIRGYKNKGYEYLTGSTADPDTLFKTKSYK